MPRREPAEPNHGIFGTLSRLARRHQLLTDGVVAAVLLIASTVWLIDSPYLGVRSAVGQALLIAPLVWRRVHPTIVFLVVAVLALVGWIIGPPLIANGAVLVALYTVATREPKLRVVAATVTAEIGAVLAGWRWHPADTVPRSVLFLTVAVVAALCAGLTSRLASQYVGWLTERARRLEIERDQQASIAAGEERTRIAREMHDIVAHSLSVLVTLVDAAARVNRSDPARADQTLHQASEVGRQALGDMRTMVRVLRTGPDVIDLVPQPGLDQIDELVEGVRATGLDVRSVIEGEAFPMGAAAELTLYRIVQESLTNVMKHASATGATVTLRFNRPTVSVEVVDNGAPGGASSPAHAPAAHAPAVAAPAADPTTAPSTSGHGVTGMRERAALHRGSVLAGPTPGGGWRVAATIRLEPTASVPGSPGPVRSGSQAGALAVTSTSATQG